MIVMKCPYCQKELETIGLKDPEWVNEDDTVAEMMCFAYCRTCGRKYSLIKRYAKVEEKDLEEM